MFDWLKKAFGDSEPERKRRRDPEPEFRPAKLPPRRSELTTTASTQSPTQLPRSEVNSPPRSSANLRAVSGALVASDKETGQVFYNMLTPHMQQFLGRCIGAIKRVGVAAVGTGQFSILVGEQRTELRLDQFYQPSDNQDIIDRVVAEARKIANLANDMKVDERFFKFTLPGRWNRLPPLDGSRWTYRSDHEQLTVSLMSFNHRLSADEQGTTLQRVTELRRRAEVETPGVPSVTMTETTFAEAGGILAARFGGFESASERRFHCLLLCSPSGVTTFYYEVIGMTQQEADSRARSIFNSAGVA